MLRSPTRTSGRPFLRLAGEPGGQLVEKSQLMGEFRVGLGVGDVAAGRDVNVVQLDPAGQLGDRVAAIGGRAPLPRRSRSANGRRDSTATPL